MRDFTYIPSSIVRRDVLTTGEERPELVGEVDRRPAPGSRLIFASFQTFKDQRSVEIFMLRSLEIGQLALECHCT